MLDFLILTLYNQKENENKQRVEKNMKFIHIADMHFDKPFTILEKNGLTEKRRLEQRNAFNKMINYIKENNIEYLFIAGDLYEHEYIRKSTIEYINNCFKKIENTKIFITPGNHDPYINNSYYKQYVWNSNVKIFFDLEEVKEENINIYGYGFTDFYSEEVKLPDNLDNNKINILLMHADLNGSTKSSGNYNSILETTFKNSKFDYVALGHIHKRNIENLKMIYPGSMISGGFDELEKHGMIEGNIDEETKEVRIKFIPLDDAEFKKEDIDISNLNSEEELIEKINDTQKEENIYYEYIFVGEKSFEIDSNKIINQINNKHVIKLKDESKLHVNLEEIAKENNLRGIYVKELLNQINADESNKEEIYRIIEIGLNAM